jgi:hypothetical protein
VTPLKQARNAPMAHALRQSSPTRACLLRSALRVAADHDVDDRAIPNVLAIAGASSAEFYRNFAKPEELWHTLAGALSSELVAMIEEKAGTFVDAARRIECGVRLYLRETRENPVFARILAHPRFGFMAMTSLTDQYLTEHLSWGNQTARFSDTCLESAIDVIAGTMLAAIQRIAAGNAPVDHAENVALAILKSLGVPAPQARRLIRVELQQLAAPSGSLLALARVDVTNSSRFS